MPQSFLILKALDKVNGVVSKKPLSLDIGKKDHKKHATYRPVKFPKILTNSSFDSSKNPQNAKKNIEKPVSLKEKTRLLPASLEDSSPLAARALHTSHFCEGERQMQTSLLTLREKDFANLLPSRCTPWCFREKLFVQDKLKNMKKSSVESKPHSFTNLSVKEEKKIDEHVKEEKEKWEEISRLKEERHFHLTRVIKYLTK